MLEKLNIHADSHPKFLVLVIRRCALAAEETARVQLAAVFITTVFFDLIIASTEFFMGVEWLNIEFLELIELVFI